MKYNIIFLSLLIMTLCCGCGNKAADETPVTSELPSEETLIESIVSEVEQPEFSWDNTTIFRYGGTEYDLSDLKQGINAIRVCEKVGKYIVADCHIGPHNGAYCIFNTETESFDKILCGHNMTWHSDDITTCVYGFWNEIYNYDGELVAKCDIPEGDLIRSIEFIEENTKIQVTITTEKEENYTVVFPLTE